MSLTGGFMLTTTYNMEADETTTQTTSNNVLPEEATVAFYACSFESRCVHN